VLNQAKVLTTIDSSRPLSTHGSDQGRSTPGRWKQLMSHIPSWEVATRQSEAPTADRHRHVGGGNCFGGDKAAAGGSGCTTGAGVRGAGARGGGAGGGGGSCSGACGLDVNSGLAASSSSEIPRILRRMVNRLISATA
jgi:hypothetical protein